MVFALMPVDSKNKPLYFSLIFLSFETFRVVFPMCNEYGRQNEEDSLWEFCGDLVWLRSDEDAEPPSE